MLQPKTFKSALAKLKQPLDAKTLRAFTVKATKLKKPLEDVLIAENALDETELYQRAAEILDIPFIGLKGREIKQDIINLIPGPVAGTHQVVAFEKEKDAIKLAMADPTDIQTIEFLRRKTGLEPKVYMTAPSDLREALRSYHTELEEHLRIIQEGAEGVAGGDLKKVAAELPVINKKVDTSILFLFISSIVTLSKFISS